MHNQCLDIHHKISSILSVIFGLLLPIYKFLYKSLVQLSTLTKLCYKPVVIILLLLLLLFSILSAP